MRLSVVIACLLGGGSVVSQATSLDYTFRPQVSIFKASPSDAIEIQAKQVNFVTSYDTSTETFYPINIPFTVRSVKGTSLDYRITLQVSEHFCTNADGTDKPFSSAVSTLLDGNPFPLINSGLEGSDGYVIKNQVEQSHSLSVLFKDNSLPQLPASQVCYGLLGVTAEIEV